MDGLESIVRMQSESLARQEQLLRKLQEKQDAQMRQMELKQSELCTCVIS